MNTLNNTNEIIRYMENCKHFNIIKIHNNFSKIDIDIDENNGSVIKMKYGLIYHTMSYCTEIQIKFTKNNLLYFVKYDKIKPNTFDTSIINCLNLDFSFKNILREHDQDKKISGSETRNNTYLYCYDLITVNILSCIYNIDKKTQNIQIIFPTIASSVVTELLYIFSYLCNELYLEKNGDWLKDSFIMCGIGIDKEKLKQLKSDLENSIKFTEKTRTKNINKIIDNVTNESFKINISKYNLLIQNICSTFWNIIFSNYKDNEIERSDNVWKIYDALLKI
jgi:hypothetical protein